MRVTCGKPRTLSMSTKRRSDGEIDESRTRKSARIANNVGQNLKITDSQLEKSIISQAGQNAYSSAGPMVSMNRLVTFF